MERIQKYINRVYRASVLDRSAAFAEENLSGYQISYILQVCRQPGLTHDDLARALFVNKSSVSRQVAKMIEADYIYREVDEEDRRSRRLYPTDKANNIYPRVIEYLEEWNDTLTSGLDARRQAMLPQLLRHLARAATDRVAEDTLNLDYTLDPGNKEGN